MASKTTTKFLWAAVLWLLFILFTITLTAVDVQPAGPQGSQIALASLNTWVFDHAGTSATWDKITDVEALISFAIAGIFAVIGLVQLIRNKSLKKVSSAIILLGIFYVLMAGFYIFFEKFVINYRPVLTDGVLEASYPSSHTFVALFIFLSAMPAVKQLTDKKWVQVLTDIVMIALCVSMVVGRVLSGQHWFTDIVGAVLLASSAAMLYDAFLYWWNNR